MIVARSNPKPSTRLPVGSLVFLMALCFSLMGATPGISADDVFHYFEVGEKPLLHLAGSRMVGLVPFVNMTGDSDIDWVGDAMTSALTEMIKKGGCNVRIIERDAFEEKRKGKIDLSELERRMINSLDIQAILMCEYRRSRRGVFRFSCRLRGPGKASEGYTISDCGTMDEIFEVQSRLSEKISACLGLTFHGEGRQRKVDVKSYEYFQRALSSPEGSYRRLHYCLKALEEDPEYVRARFCLAEAYYLIGISYGNRECLDRALREYLEVIAVDPDNLKAHYRIGMVSFLKGDYNGSRSAFERALELSPGMAEARVGLRSLAELHR